VLAVDRHQVLAYRVQAHGLHRSARDVTSLGVLDLGVQYVSVPATQQVLAARVDGDLSQDGCVTVWSFRGAPHLVRRADVPTLAAELWPRTDADALARLGGEGTVLRKADESGLTAFEKTAAALRDIVTEDLPKGEVSAAITEALPAAYSYECRGCKATHVYNTLFQSAGLAAGVELRPGTRPTILAPLADRPPHPTPAPSTRVLRAYLRLHGPATLAEVAGYLGTTQKEAKPVWPDGLTEVRVDGRTAYLPEEDVAALESAPAPDVVRLLPAFDPLLQLRDRELLVPGAAERKAVWRILGNPGAVLAGGEVVGIWRTAKAAKTRLALTVTPFGTLPARTRKAVAAEAERLADLRGATTAVVEYE
jgi:hypothetical protein